MVALHIMLADKLHRRDFYFSKEVPKLVDFAVSTVSLNFTMYPHLKGLTNSKRIEQVIESTPLNLALTISAPYIHQESYWKKACEKRPISMESIDKLVENVEQACQEVQAEEISSTLIGEKIMNELKVFDGVAYVRFASVYRQFRDVGEFMSELKDLLSKGKK